MPYKLLYLLCLYISSIKLEDTRKSYNCLKSEMIEYEKDSNEQHDVRVQQLEMEVISNREQYNQSRIRALAAEEKISELEILLMKEATLFKSRIADLVHENSVLVNKVLNFLLL